MVNDQHKGPEHLVIGNVTLTSASASGEGIGKVSGATYTKAKVGCAFQGF